MPLTHDDAARMTRTGTCFAVATSATARSMLAGADGIANSTWWTS